ncbi:C-3 sterol dehydrogenase/C-4 sterol decarboxylase [Anopheles sinensis]|uniref:C-3 sterol dehydrogenase/C-4 sterol decarboxylase n=1 Tax=Anopheles sinensis TaxID=74873 RepID=A0A084WRH7_ANOSI|nr:C-3 sterol dehydrogenase/C-4 sterol decarboxylase [Anopheles sinensis]
MEEKTSTNIFGNITLGGSSGSMLMVVKFSISRISIPCSRSSSFFGNHAEEMLPPPTLSCDGVGREFAAFEIFFLLVLAGWEGNERTGVSKHSRSSSIE